MTIVAPCYNCGYDISHDDFLQDRVNFTCPMCGSGYD